MTSTVLCRRSLLLYMSSVFLSVEPQGRVLLLLQDASRGRTLLRLSAQSGALILIDLNRDGTRA
jgi:hypothetical protein